jgi:hypothetical protein
MLWYSMSSIIFGIWVDKCMDRRTVRRAIEKGGVAARMQAIYELS